MIQIQVSGRSRTWPWVSINSNEETSWNFDVKVRAAEILSAAAARRLMGFRFPGPVSVVVQNGRVLKSGYEPSDFRHRGEAYPLDCGRKQYRKMKR
jgi:hypothetical protein